MVVIGLCGSSGSGKGYICQLFTERGIKWIDTDKVYRDITSSRTPCIEALADIFGIEILNEDGSLNRKELSKLVFNGEKAEENRKNLNRIAHSFILMETENLITAYKLDGAKAVLVDAPLLFESGFDKMCDVTICVTAPFETKLERIMKRDNLSLDDALARLRSQLSDDELRARCNYEIDNSGNKEIDSQLDSILKALNL